MSTATQPLPKDLRIGLFLILALVMMATRSHHFGALPDASWAVFFVAGFYLRGSARWAFPLLMALAVVVDCVVIRSQGIDFWSHYCVSPAYWFLVPSYAALWFGGSWLRARYNGLHAREAGLLAASAALSAAACYVVSNGSFYWISPSVPSRSFGGWIENLGDWFVPFMQTTLAYIAVAAVLHVAVVVAAKALRGMSAARAIR
jgi:hypothetical protein